VISASVIVAPHGEGLRCGFLEFGGLERLPKHRWRCCGVRRRPFRS